MIQNKIVQIILGAGRPFSGDQNASLKKVSNDTRVLDWTLQAAKFLNPEVHFVAGYQIDDIKDSELMEDEHMAKVIRDYTHEEEEEEDEYDDDYLDEDDY